MKIAINSRLYQKRSTGVGFYIKSLYEELLQMEGGSSYIFFQPTESLTLGPTRTPKTWLSKKLSRSSIVFDHFVVQQFIGQEEEQLIFHGPGNTLPFSKKRGVRYVLTIHDLAFLVFPNDYPVSFRFYYRLVMRRSIKNADVIVVDSENTKHDVMKFYGVLDQDIKVVHLGVSEFYFEPVARTQLTHGKYFLTLTTHTKRKNIIGVLNAFAHSPLLSDLACVIVGLIPNAESRELKEKIHDLGIENRVTLLGYVNQEDLRSLYQHAEFFIYPSFYEGFGLPILEAMASNCPVITSRNSSLTEITPDNTWLVDPYSQNDIREKMTAMVNLDWDKRQSLIEYNRTFAKGFTWAETAKAMSSIFEDL